MNSDTPTEATVSQKLGGLAYRVFCGILRVLDIRVVAVFGRCVGYIVWAVMPGRRRIVARNMRIVVDPMLRGSKLSALVRRNIVRTTMNMACTFKTGLMTDKELNRAVKLVGAESFEDKAAGGDCVIGCIPHAGNWEILARIRPLFPRVKRFGSMYRRLDNPVLEDIVYKSRTRFGCEMFSSKKGLKEVFRLARDGGMLGVLSDQFTQQGLFLPYFGKVTGTTPLPSLIYKRCRGTGHLLAVSTRNTGLGKWEAVLSREIQVPAGDLDLAEITLEVNKSLEEVQKESIIDGFWMHHRWKCTRQFAPVQTEQHKELIRSNFKLPFRCIICLPEEFEEAVLTIPFLRGLRASREDMQLTVVCPAEQQAFWQTQKYIANAVSTENTLQQLDADEVYKDGPFDVLFMLSENRRVFRDMQELMPMYASGFATSPFRKKLRAKCVLKVGEAPTHRTKDYLALLSWHAISHDGTEYAAPDSGNATVEGKFIAPFSSLGAADCWPQEKWKEAVSRLGANTSLIAFESDCEAAEKMASELGIPCVLVKPETVAEVLGPNCHLYAVDGLMPQLAALAGCRCNVIMASRLAAVYAPPGEGHKTVTQHVPCHPCYRRECDQPATCAAGISADEFLAE
ncbi:MAG: hypothetical protein IJN23_07945 [Akkermansia sp.]|nr:hypothetical protein [Akkermansia sp.]